MQSEHWFEPMYRSIDAMELDAFMSHLAADVVVCVGNAPPMKGQAAVRQGIGGFWASIGGLTHRFTNVAESSGRTFIESLVEYLRKDGNRVTIPVVTVLERTAGKVSALRIYFDLAPVFA